VDDAESAAYATMQAWREARDKMPLETSEYEAAEREYRAAELAYYKAKR
jgi:hypothetical protein